MSNQLTFITKDFCSNLDSFYNYIYIYWTLNSKSKIFQVSGLTKHQSTSEKPLKYSHLDVAGSSGNLPEPTTGSSVVALSMHFFQ